MTPLSIGVLLTIIFTVLKLTGFVGWTWPGVLIPLFIELGIDALIVLVVIFGGVAVWKKL